MTRFDLDSSVGTLLKGLSHEGSARLVGFLDKRESKFGTIKTEVEKRFNKFTRAELAVDNIELASRIISRRRKRYQTLFPLWETRQRLRPK